MDEKIKKEVSQVLKNVSHNVRLTYFSKEKGCPLCKKQQEIIAEIVSLSRKLELQVHDIEKSGKEAERYHIEKVPATAVIGKKDYGIRFYGLTGGHEFTSLINAIIMVGSDRSGLHPELEKLIKKIEQPVHIEVMVTLTCPYCPQAVHAAQQLAMVNDHINADMVDSAEFPDLAQRYEVFETPKTVINETHSFVGAQPVQAVYLEVLKAVDPREYERIDQMIRETQGHRHVKKPELQTKYDTIIVGGGPAAMSAAIYAARKEMNVLLVAKELGRQITYTANVENYLGLPNLSGRNMRDQFLVHMEQYPIAESVGANVLTVGKKNSTFIVKTEGKKEYKGNSVIFCTGKEYRRLGVPGEEKFIGRGIAFCATCDAPLYRGKKVAVVGGGNSAFTAVRDLINFADEIHLVHRKDSFKADISLVKHVKSTKKVLLHTNMVVQEFLGDDTLRGVRLKSTQEQETLDIEVDGVFLEIGLTPNTEAVKDLIQLNARGEIPVKSDNSTALSGFFAAGDVTDVPEKQIIVAAGEGAKAAISAYKYLIEEQLVEKKTVVEEWE